MNGESFLNSCSQKNTWFTNKIVLRDLTSGFYCFPSIYELNPSNKMWALGTHNLFFFKLILCALAVKWFKGQFLFLQKFVRYIMFHLKTNLVPVYTSH